jgi:hypothetical protein
MGMLATKEIIKEVNEVINKDSVSIQGTSETPEIKLDKNEGIIKFSGRSMPEDAKSFYNPLKQWIEQYSQNPKQGTKVIFAYEYFNTASSKMVMEVIECVKKIQEKDPDMVVEWHYMEDDDDMLEAGEDYSDITGIEFEYFSYE